MKHFIVSLIVLIGMLIILGSCGSDSNLPGLENSNEDLSQGIISTTDFVSEFLFNGVPARQVGKWVYIMCCWDPNSRYRCDGRIPYSCSYECPVCDIINEEQGKNQQ